MQDTRLGFVVVTCSLIAAASVGIAQVVSNTNDSGPGSLRQVIQNAAGGITITFATNVVGMITLTSGELLITNNVTIQGPGATVLGVDGNATGRVFHVTNSVVAAISGLTITNGNVSGARGGGILSEGSTLTLSNCTVSGNFADFGGGIYIDNSTVTMANCTISGNSPYYYGGGIYNHYSALTVSNCAISGNSAGEGGGIYEWGYFGSVALTVIASTFSSNSAPGGLGGGILNEGQSGNAMLTVITSTFSDNSAGYAGGAIYNHTCAPGSATLKVVACTFSGNSANSGGGIYNTAYGCPEIHTTFNGNSATGASSAGGATLEIGDTILNAGAAGENITNLAGTVTSDGYNLSSDNGGGFLTSTGDHSNTDPRLGPLADNGGRTKTMALRVGSPAIDQGKSLGVSTDQRGEPRIYINPNSALPPGGDGADIGAYEASELRVIAAQRAANHLRLDFTSWLGTNYEVQSRSEMTIGSWASLPGSTPGNGGIANSTVSNAFNQSQQFYRIHPVP